MYKCEIAWFLFCVVVYKILQKRFQFSVAPTEDGQQGVMKLSGKSIKYMYNDN